MRAILSLLPLCLYYGHRDNSLRSSWTTSISQSKSDSILTCVLSDWTTVTTRQLSSTFPRSWCLLLWQCLQQIQLRPFLQQDVFFSSDNRRCLVTVNCPGKGKVRWMCWSSRMPPAGLSDRFNKVPKWFNFLSSDLPSEDVTALTPGAEHNVISLHISTGYDL